MTIEHTLNLKVIIDASLSSKLKIYINIDFSLSTLFEKKATH